MEHVDVLFVDEAVHLNYSQIQQLHKMLGPKGAEDVTVRAMEEVAARLGKSEALFLREDWTEFRRIVRSLVAISDQIGMASLARVSCHVVDALDQRNTPAVAATFFRLLRTADRSLSDYWDLQDMSG